MKDILDLPGLTVVSESTDEANKVRRFVAEVTNQGSQVAQCPSCGKGQLLRSGRRSTTYRDLPIRGYRVIIKANLQRYRCRQCAKTTIEEAPGMARNRFMTARCVDWIRRKSLRTSFSEVAEEIGCSRRTVLAIVCEYIRERSKDYSPSMPQWLGIDEVALSGDRRYCIFFDAENRKLVDIVSDSNLRTITAWLTRFSEHQDLRGVCIDMCSRQRTAVERLFPEVEIIVNRYHLLKLADDALEHVRRAVEKKHPEGRRSLGWERNKALLRKPGHSLSVVERISLESWLAQHPELAGAYRLRKQFWEIFDEEGRSDAERALTHWERSIPAELRPAFKILIVAVKTWRKQIVAYFGHSKRIKYSSWPSSGIRSARRLSRGCSFEILRGRLLFGKGEEPAHHSLAA